MGKLLKLAKVWQSPNPSHTKRDREFIENETKFLFRANKNERDPEEIKKLLFEAEARYTIALHYQTPFPLPYNLMQGTSIDREKMVDIMIPEYYRRYYNLGKPKEIIRPIDTRADFEE